MVLLGWKRLPATVRAASILLGLVYLTSALVNDEAVVSAQTRATGSRSLVTLLDLLLGMSVVCLVCGLACRGALARALVTAVVVGAVVAALYGLYQIPAHALGLPLADVNNALNSDGVTRGYKFQGVGLFGFERVRGTFTEPRAYGAYLATALPLLLVAFAPSARHVRRWPLLVAGALLLGALLSTTSSLSWAALGLAALLGAWLFAIAIGRPFASLVLACATGLGLVLIVLLLVEPAPLSTVTQRPSASLQRSAEFRLEAWAAVEDEWARRPVLGHGPGQSAVRLARPAPGARSPEGLPVVLGSAQGFWSAALVDAGVLGLGAWILFLSSVLVSAGRSLYRRGAVADAGVFVAVMTAVLTSLASADRLDFRVWVVVGLAIAAVAGRPDGEAGEYDQDEAQAKAAQGPRRGLADLLRPPRWRDDREANRESHGPRTRP